MGNNAKTVKIGTVSRLRFCRRSCGFKIYVRWNVMRFWKPYSCSNHLDVKETNFSFAQFIRIRNHFMDAGLWMDGIPALDLWDLIVTVLHGNTHQNDQVRWDPYTNLFRVNPHKLSTRKEFHGMIDDLDNVDFNSSNTKIISDSICNERPQGEWDRVAESMMNKFRESGHPVFRATSPLSRGQLQSKGGGTVDTLLCRFGHDKKLFRAIISVNQLSIYGAVSDVCDEYSTCQTSTERPVLAEQSDPLFAPASLLMTTPTRSTEVFAREFFWKVQGTNGRALTTRSIDQDFYWCRISENSWSRAVLHDKAH